MNYWFISNKLLIKKLWNFILCIIRVSSLFGSIQIYMSLHFWPNISMFCVFCLFCFWVQCHLFYIIFIWFFIQSFRNDCLYRYQVFYDFGLTKEILNKASCCHFISSSNFFTSCSRLFNSCSNLFLVLFIYSKIHSHALT